MSSFKNVIETCGTQTRYYISIESFQSVLLSCILLVDRYGTNLWLQGDSLPVQALVVEVEERREGGAACEREKNDRIQTCVV